jgi:hypothetical protein
MLVSNLSHVYNYNNNNNNTKKRTLITRLFSSSKDTLLMSCSGPFKRMMRFNKYGIEEIKMLSVECITDVSCGKSFHTNVNIFMHDVIKSIIGLIPSRVFNFQELLKKCIHMNIL